MSVALLVCCQEIGSLLYNQAAAQIGKLPCWSCGRSLLLTFNRVGEDMNDLFGVKSAITCCCLLLLCLSQGCCCSAGADAAGGACCLLLLPVLHCPRRGWLMYAPDDPGNSYLYADEQRKGCCHCKLQQAKHHLCHNCSDHKRCS